VIRPTKILLHK